MWYGHADAAGTAEGLSNNGRCAMAETPAMRTERRRSTPSVERKGQQKNADAETAQRNAVS